jgi:hypothetical protein
VTAKDYEECRKIGMQEDGKGNAEMRVKGKALRA